MSSDKDQICRATLLGQTANAIHVCEPGPLNGRKPKDWWFPRSQLGYMRIDRAPPETPGMADSVVFSCPVWLLEEKQAWELAP